MIENDAQLDQATRQLAIVYRELARIRKEVGEKPELFAVLAEGPLGTVETIQNEIDVYCGTVLASEGHADIWLRIAGQAITWPLAKASVLTKYVDAINSAVLSVANCISSNRFTESLRLACDFDVVALKPGSLIVGLKLPDSPLSIDPDVDAARESTETVLQVAAWAASGADVVTLRDKVLNRNQRRTALNAIKPLIPSGKGAVDSVELYRRERKPRKIVLTNIVSTRIHVGIDDTLSEKEVSGEGEIREMDLDGPSFILRKDGASDIDCVCDKHLLPRISLGRQVRVFGIRMDIEYGRFKNPLQVTDIEDLD